MVSGSFRRSSFVPTRMKGTPGAWWLISGYHLVRMFSKDVGFVMEKQSRKTSVCGYDRGRRRS